MSKQVTIIGAGIVGVCCARFLQNAGFAVTLLDSEGPGEGTSFGNLGMLCTTEHSLPLPSVSLLTQVPRMLANPNAPLSIRWRYLPRLLPWMLRVVINTPERTRMKNALAMAALMKDTIKAYETVLEDSAARALVRHRGFLEIYQHDKSFRADARERERIKQLGVSMEILDTNEIRQLEPALGRNCRFGVFFPDGAHCINPFAMTETIAQDVLQAGGHYQPAKVVGAHTNDTGVTELVTTDGPLPVENVVLAAGAWSGELAARLGSPVPLDTERGYHTILHGVDAGLQRPVGHAESSIGVTQMETGLRIGGSVELASLDAPPNYARASHFYEQGRELLPDLPPTDELELSQWMGFRPTLPDYLPVIGRSPRHKNLWFAFGHQHLGLSLGARTGELIAELMSGRGSSIDLDAFRINRF